MGDLKKITHIIEGYNFWRRWKGNGITFYQFGKYLSNKKAEPIIDQHIIRAFGIYEADDDEKNWTI